MRPLSLLSSTACGIVIACTSPVLAATTFLPDWQNAGLNFQNNEGNYTRDETLCIEAVDKSGKKLYHKASSCPKPKIFDEHCAHDDRYISECYCPAHYQYTCVAPYRGDERVKKDGYASCDGKYIACCDGSCPSGTSKTNPGGCGGSTTNDCGDTCYYPYQPCCTPLPSESNCSCGSGSCSDGCGGTRTCCSTCYTPPPSGGGGGSSNTSSNGGGGGGGGSSSDKPNKTCHTIRESCNCSPISGSCHMGSSSYYFTVSCNCTTYTDGVQSGTHTGTPDVASGYKSMSECSSGMHSVSWNDSWQSCY